MNEGVSLFEVTYTAVWIMVVTVIAVMVFRGMASPRLRLEMVDGKLRTTRRHVLVYVLTIPLLIALWLAYFTLLIVASPAETSPETLMVMPSAVVIGVRVLAHVNSDAAYHLGSVVPIVIIAAILIGQGIPDSAIAGDLSETDDTFWAFFLVLGIDYLTTFIWYWCKTRLPGFPGPDPRLPRKQRRHISRYAAAAPQRAPEQAGPAISDSG
ncbi:MAG: hypothetical protein KDC39_00215 [Actinobacteria bacterium]|nr:hypothetical protein [Actinomycetota bacterium]